MRYWEISSDEEGCLIVERKGSGWEFMPNKPLGRPKTIKPMGPFDVNPPLPSGIKSIRLENDIWRRENE